MTELVLQAGGSMSWATLRKATDLLADREKLARHAEAQFGQVADDWLALKGDSFDATHRFDQLSGLCHVGRMRVVEQDAELVVELRNLDGHQDFPHVRFDARLALAVAHDMVPLSAPDAAAVLAFDIAAMVLSMEGAGYHPRFLIHDGPREADMARLIYERFFLYARKLEQSFNDYDAASFQYIITTTTPPPKDMQRENEWLRMTLNTTQTNERFLREDL
jgi:hypothetical protein